MEHTCMCEKVVEQNSLKKFKNLLPIVLHKWATIKTHMMKLFDIIIFSYDDAMFSQ